MKAIGHPHDTVTAASLREEQKDGRIVVPIQALPRIELRDRLVDVGDSRQTAIALADRMDSVPRRRAVIRWAEVHLGKVRKELTR